MSETPEPAQPARRGRPRPGYTIERDAVVAAVLSDGERYNVNGIVTRIVGMDDKQVRASLTRLRCGDGNLKQPSNPRVFQPERGFWQATSYALTYDKAFGGDGTERHPQVYTSTAVRLKTPEELAGVTPSAVSTDNEDDQDTLGTTSWQ